MKTNEELAKLIVTEVVVTLIDDVPSLRAKMRGQSDAERAEMIESLNEVVTDCLECHRTY